MKIKFFLSNNDLAPTTVSGKLIANALIKYGYNVEIVQELKRKREILDNPDCQVIIFQKTIYRGHFFEEVKHLIGKVSLVYIDDDFLGMDDKRHLNVLNNADLILVGNKYHAKLLKKYTKTPAEAFISIHDFENYPYKPFEDRNNDPLIISWQQSLADVYIEDLLSIKDSLIKIHKKYGVKLHLYGWHEGKHYNKPDNRPIIKKEMPFAEFISFQPYESYNKNIVPRIANSDILIVPYLNKPERYGKGGFGLKRMMMLGIPVVVSNIAIHNEIIEDGVNGYLVESRDEWYEKIEKLILNPDLRKKFSIVSRKLIEDRYSYDSCVSIFIDALKKHIPNFK